MSRPRRTYSPEELEGMPPFARRLRQVMTERKTTNTDLAGSAGVSKNTIISFLCGRYEPRIGTAVKIADALGVSLDWLCGTKYGSGGDGNRELLAIGRKLLRDTRQANEALKSLNGCAMQLRTAARKYRLDIDERSETDE